MNLNKLLSGKFIFTIITSIVFLYATVYDILSSEQVHGIILLVVAFYFSKRIKNEDNKNEN